MEKGTMGRGSGWGCRVVYLGCEGKWNGETQKNMLFGGACGIRSLFQGRSAGGATVWSCNYNHYDNYLTETFVSSNLNQHIFYLKKNKILRILRRLTVQSMAKTDIWWQRPNLPRLETVYGSDLSVQCVAWTLTPALMIPTSRTQLSWWR